MKKGNTAIVLILVLIVAAIGAFSMFKISNPSGALQSSEWTGRCCRTGVAFYSSAAQVGENARCKAAYFDGYQAILEQCPSEFNKPVDVKNCQQTETVPVIGGCKVNVCCNIMS